MNTDLIDPLPQEWITSCRSQYLTTFINPVGAILKESGVLESVLSYWIVDEIIFEYNVKHNNFKFLADEKSDPSNQSQNNEDKKSSRLNSILLWSKDKWYHRIETLYLENKDKLDLISFKMIRVKSKEFAYEIYHRLKADEASFEELSLRYGQGPEKRIGGKCKIQTSDSIPKILVESVKKSSQGDILKPIPYGKQFAVIEFDQWQSAQLDENTESILLQSEFENWSKSIVDHILNHILILN